MLKKFLAVLAFIAVAVAGSIGKLIGETTSGSVASATPKQQDVEVLVIEGFAKAAAQINRTLPKMIDEDTRLDKVTVGPGARTVYHYSSPKHTSRDFDGALLRATLRPDTMLKVCAAREMKKSLQYGGVYAYSYSGNDGIKIVEFEIDRNDCGLTKISS